ncbi:hypothetical protein PR202_gb05274 [Eleusine coracana subsp. coracana]|uniref:Uncharacterized protein n=1 Tax=Eleusine coracana subsp. coracana TaxID=191504 RepID=A0AAV5E4X8_ELECO|nr:hypothetical protein PR202_gb05274 [Eleusine coracana subsp. coracana]
MSGASMPFGRAGGGIDVLGLLQPRGAMPPSMGHGGLAGPPPMSGGGAAMSATTTTTSSSSLQMQHFMAHQDLGLLQDMMMPSSFLHSNGGNIQQP